MIAGCNSIATVTISLNSIQIEVYLLTREQIVHFIVKHKTMHKKLQNLYSS